MLFRSAQEQLSLNEQIVKLERESNRRAAFDAENMRRLLKGLSLEEWVSDAERAAAEAEEETAAEFEDDVTLAANEAPDEEEEVVEEEDPLLLESGRILADFIALNERHVNALGAVSADR